jgi:Holliday junction resolvase RusA-like endonuclease
MGRKVVFRLNAVPVAQGRPRLTTIGGMARAFDPAKSRDWKAYVNDHAMRAMSHIGEVLTGPIECRIRFGFACPKGEYRKREPKPRRWHEKKPDIDNLAKAILDACCNGTVALSDTNIVRLICDKIICRQGEPPFVSVLFQEIDDFVDSQSASS